VSVIGNTATGKLWKSAWPIKCSEKEKRMKSNPVFSRNSLNVAPAWSHSFKLRGEKKEKSPLLCGRIQWSSWWHHTELAVGQMDPAHTSGTGRGVSCSSTSQQNLRGQKDITTASSFVSHCQMRGMNCVCVCVLSLSHSPSSLLLEHCYSWVKLNHRSGM